MRRSLFLDMLSDWPGRIFVVIMLAVAVFVPLANLVAPAGSALHLPDYMVGLLGKYMCFALLALSVDLIWGFAGILSLGHGAFFALGGYGMLAFQSNRKRSVDGSNEA